MISHGFDTSFKINEVQFCLKFINNALFGVSTNLKLDTNWPIYDFSEQLYKYLLESMLALPMDAQWHTWVTHQFL